MNPWKIPSGNLWEYTNPDTNEIGAKMIFFWWAIRNSTRQEEWKFWIQNSTFLAQDRISLRLKKLKFLEEVSLVIRSDEVESQMLVQRIEKNPASHTWIK